MKNFSYKYDKYLPLSKGSGFMEKDEFTDRLYRKFDRQEFSKKGGGIPLLREKTVPII